MKLSLKILSVLFVSFVLLVAICYVSCRFIWGELDLGLMIWHAPLIKSYPLSLFWKEIVGGTIAFVLLLVLAWRYWKTSLVVSLCLVGTFVCLESDFSSQSNDLSLYKKEYLIPNLKKQKLKKPKNIIVISLEAFETTLTHDDVTNAGNLFPKLTELQKEGLVFTGYNQLENIASFTMPSFYSKNCGIGAFNGSLRKNAFRTFKIHKKYGKFSNKVCVSDILKDKGYSVFFVMGGNFGDEGTKNFFGAHPIDKAVGRTELKKLGYKKPDEFTFIPDSELFRYVKKTISENKDKPFAIYVVTGDNHVARKNGYYVEPQCVKKYDDVRDAYKCMDGIVFDFVRWCKAQPWWDDTVIYLLGDHLSRVHFRDVDALDTKNRDKYRREIYTLLLGKGYQGAIYKEYTHVDFAPTFLESIGFVAPKFGLGYSLFRDKPTLIEKLGVQEFDKQLKGSTNEFLETDLEALKKKYRKKEKSSKKDKKHKK